ncbi:CPBP family intramembrane glutamic endopeptidase [Lachnoclostridium sp. Marseille-P6806]|uniref:CPBP family intramembrane glutamic endopeptidase n=1 Tax=Lachnoclostridium sp. Marseille-P6806 TaxID=2364793 RepID=UPI0013EF51DF|nr:CPBP family intramembrane glutamic endopeptidase [Lachnoclostridium sp. Marseille-P6806]
MSLLYLLPPFLAETALLVIYYIEPKHTLFAMLVFYLFVILYFRRLLDFRLLKKSLADVRGFWVPVGAATGGLVLAYGAKLLLSRLLDGIASEGVTAIWTENDVRGMLLYTLVCILLAPVAQELYFRGAMIRLCAKERNFMIFDAVCGMLLCAVLQVHSPLGILEVCLIQLPLVVAYIRTRNIYVPMTVNFIWCLWQNLEYVLYSLARISYS